jgi:parallel beta-helix repeat protein
MKALDEIEPRINIQRAVNPLPSDANYYYIISTSGSYYLTGSVDVASKPSGIHVTVPGVTIDLNGFQIAHGVGSGGTGAGIVIDAPAHGCTVKNGTISGFGNGVLCVLSGIYPRGGAFLDLSVSGCSGNALVTGDAWQVDSCKVHGNPGVGILAQDNCVISNCMVKATSGGYGIRANNGASLSNCTVGGSTGTAAIYAGGGSSLTNCIATSNTVTSGIFAGAASTLQNCSAFFNTGTYGIQANGGCTLVNCAATGNTAVYAIWASAGSMTNCAAQQNTSSAAASYGIYSSATSLHNCTAVGNISTAGTLTSSTGVGIYADTAVVQNCSVLLNYGDGIRAGFDTLVTGNVSKNNGNSVGGADGAGIHVLNLRNVIEDNTVNGNKRGIDVGSTGNLIIKNNARSNATNFVIATDNRYGPIVDIGAGGAAAVNGSSALSTVTSTDPWANFAY